MRIFRKTIFWLHLVAGAVAGLVIGMMSLTGAILAFEQEIVAWAERDLRQVAIPGPDAERLEIDELQRRFAEVFPETEPTGIAVSRDPAAAVVFSVGREARYFANPYSGEIREAESAAARDFMASVTQWHRWFALSGEKRTWGRAVTGACNLAFVFLGISGLYLWFPRRWSWQHFRPVIWFRRGLRGKAREWNWHNVLGFWSLPVILVLAGTAVVISYPWAGNLVYRMAGEEPPPPGRGRSRGPAAEMVAPVAAGTQPLRLEEVAENARRLYPDWTELTLRPGGVGDDGSRETVAVTVRENGGRIFESRQLALDPFSGEVRTAQSFEDRTKGQKARAWIRYLHTGQALGIPGQLVAGVASAIGAVLVWTGYSLAWRRFRKSKV